MVTRPTKDETFIALCLSLGQQSTCIRRHVGCILVNKHNHIIGSGYNGNAAGLAHCIAAPCSGSKLPSGEGLDRCEAIHAEQNALMQCSNINTITIAYVSTFPCMHCIKMLLNTSCQHIVYCNDYANFEQTTRLWTSAGRTYKQVNYE